MRRRSKPYDPKVGKQNLGDKVLHTNGKRVYIEREVKGKKLRMSFKLQKAYR